LDKENRMRMTTTTLAAAGLTLLLATGTAWAQPQPVQMTPLQTLAQSGDALVTDVHYRRGGWRRSSCHWERRCWWSRWHGRQCRWVRHCW
jgi:hypothetical protein